jgi:hypothetical protein
MKKYLLVFTILMSAAYGAFAQDDNTLTKIGIGGSVGGAIGPVASTYPVGSELNLRLEFPLEGTPVSLTFNTGLTFYLSSNGYNVDYTTDGGDYSSGSVAVFLPVQVGARFYATHKFFLEGDVGGSFNLNSPSSEFTSQKVAFLVTPQAGFTFPFGASRFSLDASLLYEDRFESGGGYGQIAARVAFNFGL